MAVVYYPKDQLLYSRDTSQGNYEAIVLSSSPDVVLYFGTASVPTSASALDMPITCSWAKSASISLTYITTTSASVADTASYLMNYALTISASWASQSLSASYASNAGNPAYTTITTSSLNWVTCSFDVPNQVVNFTLGQLYNFTASSLPANGTVADTTLFINNTAATTSSLLFPSNWVWIGAAPSSLSSSKSAMLSLRAYDATRVVAACGIQYN